MAVRNRPLRKGKYNPDQKRDPGGEGGGQWTKDGGSDDKKSEGWDQEAEDAEMEAYQNKKPADKDKQWEKTERGDWVENDREPDEDEAAHEEELEEAARYLIRNDDSAGLARRVLHEGDEDGINSILDTLNIKGSLEDLGDDGVEELLSEADTATLAGAYVDMIYNIKSGAWSDLRNEMDLAAEKFNKGESTMAKRMLFVPITKMDEEKRLVYGVMADETPDKSSEIFDYETSKPHFEKWSGDMHKASDGKSYGNVRAMHGNVAAGRLDQISFDDEHKSIECVAKVVDENEWQKCLEGVYTGFSIGGSYVKKWKEGDTGKYRYTANPAEVSLVDSSCNPSAAFALAKADGSHVLVEFKPFIPTNEEVATRATALAKAAGHEDWTMMIEDARVALIDEHEGLAKAEDDKGEGDKDAAAEEKVEAKGKKKGKGKEGSDRAESDAEADAEGADEEEESEEGGKVDKAAAVQDVAQVWKATDGKTFEKKAEAVDHQAVLNARATVNPLTAALEGLKKAVAGEEDGGTVLVIPGLEKIPPMFADLTQAAGVLKALYVMAGEDPLQLRKGMWDVSSMAMAIESLSSVQSCIAWEAEYEKDGSKVPQALKDNIAQLCVTFVNLAMEEAAELVGRMKPEQIEILETDNIATQTVDPTLDPEVAVVASAAYKYLKLEHDVLEKRGARNSKNDMGRLQKAHDALVELGVTCKDQEAEKAAHAEDLQKMAGVFKENEELKKAIDGALPQIAELRATIEEIKKLPQQGAPRTHVVEKFATAEADTPKSITVEDLAKMFTPEQMQMAYIKLAQQNPQDAMSRG